MYLIFIFILVPIANKILSYSLAAFTTTLFIIKKQRNSEYIVSRASDGALAGRALLLGTMASCAGVGILVGGLAAAMKVSSFREFRMKTDAFFIRHNIKRPPDQEDNKDLLLD